MEKRTIRLGSRRPDRARRTLVVAVILLLGGVAVAAWEFFGDRGRGRPRRGGRLGVETGRYSLQRRRAYEYLKKLCAIGPRPSGSPGMEIQQKLLAAHFQKLGGQVEFQRFRVPHPQTGVAVPMANIVVHWHPKSTSRILLCGHYDTLPYPMRDPDNPRGTFVGANDNASGVAMLMELARDMPALTTKYGVDFLFLDGEEFIFSQRGPVLLGLGVFRPRVRQNKPRYRYRWGVLLDMVGDADLRLYEERNSVWWKDTRAAGRRDMGARPRGWACGSSSRSRTRGRRRPRRAARRGPYPVHRRDRFRLSALAHPRRHARQMFAAEPGQGGLGAAGMAEDSERMTKDKIRMTME